MTDDERAIRDLVATWMKASEASDVQTVLSLMADDVSFMVPGREPFGKDAFRDGDWAYIRNYLEITINQPYSALCPKTPLRCVEKPKRAGNWRIWIRVRTARHFGSSAQTCGNSLR
jgi:hypothetical protein